MIIGLVLVIFGLAFFVMGLEIGLFPIGEAMAEAFARKGSLSWLLIFGFGLGFATTVAEPTLLAVSFKEAGTGVAVVIDVEQAVGLESQLDHFRQAAENHE